jgi:hypothetical protein
VLKWFKTGAVFEDTFFEHDLQAVAKAQEIIDAYNAEGLINRTIQLNHPAVWMFKEGSRYIHKQVKQTHHGITAIFANRSSTSNVWLGYSATAVPLDTRCTASVTFSCVTHVRSWAGAGCRGWVA